MGQMRIKNGLAFGRENNFYAGIAGQGGYLAGTGGVFAQGNTAPSVTAGVLFYSNNSSATTITNFTLRHPAESAGGNLAGLFEGKVIKVWFLDSNTRIAGGGPIFLAGSDGAQGANTYLEFMYRTSGWYEIDRSRPGTDNIAVTSASIGASGTFDATGKKVINTQATAGSAIILRKATGGEQGQMLTILNGGSSLTLVVNSGGADSFVSSSSTGAATMVIVGSDALQFVRAGAQWWEIRPAGLTVNAL